MSIVIPEAELVDVGKLKVDGENPNVMTEKQLARLKTSIQRYGFIVPIITNRDLLVADGEQRLTAARELKLAQVPVVRLDVEDVDRRLLRQVLNKLRGEHDLIADAYEFEKIISAGREEDLKRFLDLSDAQLERYLVEIHEPKRVPPPKPLEEVETDIEVGDRFKLGESELFCGDCVEAMKTLQDATVDMVMFSPPYWGLRDYGIEGQIGLEPHPSEWIGKMVSVCKEIRRVLKKSGSMYLNVGDTYYGQHGHDKGKLRFGKPNVPYKGHSYPEINFSNLKSNWLQPKQLLGMPWRLAIALQEESWILRNAIVWHKPNPMPSSVKDRLNNTYEFIFHFVKNRRYYYDLDAIRQPHKRGTSIQRTNGDAYRPFKRCYAFRS